MSRREEDREGLLDGAEEEEEEVEEQEWPQIAVANDLEVPINFGSTAPRDRFYLCHIAFFVIGLSQLLPWNFLVTATNYWMFKFRNVNGSMSISTRDRVPAPNGDNKSDLQAVFDSYLAIASNAPFLLIFALSFSKRLKRLNETVKNCAAFILLTIVFASITGFVLVDTDKFQSTFLWLTLGLVFLLNSVASFIQANFAGLASLLPNATMHMMVTGQAMSGLFAVIAQILSLVGAWSIIESTFAYFMFANIIIVVTLCIYYATTQSKFFCYYTSISLTDSDRVADDLDLSAYRVVFKKMWPYCVTLMINFWTSLSVYPAVVVLIVSPASSAALSSSFWNGKFFLPVCCFLVFNLCDFIGRYLGRFALLTGERAGRRLLSIAVLRLAFVPLFMFCNVHPRHLPVLFESQYFYIAFMIAFGVSNGYLVLNVFVNGPLAVPLAYRKLSGFFLMLFLGLGLTLGSFTSTVLVRIL